MPLPADPARRNLSQTLSPSLSLSLSLSPPRARGGGGAAAAAAGRPNAPSLIAARSSWSFCVCAKTACTFSNSRKAFSCMLGGSSACFCERSKARLRRRLRCSRYSGGMRESAFSCTPVSATASWYVRPMRPRRCCSFDAYQRAKKSSTADLGRTEWGEGEGRDRWRGRR
jgi:hypothetical protein